jgi:hypothetical protein
MGGEAVAAVAGMAEVAAGDLGEAPGVAALGGESGEVAATPQWAEVAMPGGAGAVIATPKRVVALTAAETISKWEGERPEVATKRVAAASRAGAGKAISKGAAERAGEARLVGRAAGAAARGRPSKTRSH